MKNCKCSLCDILNNNKKPIQGTYYCYKQRMGVSIHEFAIIFYKQKKVKNLYSYAVFKDYFEFGHRNGEFLTVKNNNEILFNNFSLENLITYINIFNKFISLNEVF